MPSLDPTHGTLNALRDKVPAETPIQLLNLLRFKAHAEYPSGTDEHPCSGREAYARYLRAVADSLAEVGAHVRLQARALQTLVAPQGEQWDQVLVFEFPSLVAFLSLLENEQYKAAAVHRTAALMDSRLVCTTEAPMH